MTEKGGERRDPVQPLPSWVPEGWYPDPLSQGAARYWDGKHWTLDYRDNPPPQPVPTDPPQVAAASADTTDSPSTAAGASSQALDGKPSIQDRWRKIGKGGKIGIVVAAVLVLLIIIGAAAGGNKSTTSTQANNATSASTASSAPALPPIALKFDTGDYSVTSSHTTLHGTVTSGATVTVAGEPAQVDGTRWSKTVALEIGSNAENAEATMAGHASATQTITVIRHHTQAELEAQAREKREAEQREKEERERTERKEREEKEIENATVSQKNALREAESYLQSSSFSEAGLIAQLSSEAGSKYPQADAEWAVHHLHVNWNDQAVKEARSYLKSSSFSCQGLIEQLSSEAGSKFTQAQAEYAARQVGLC